MKYTQYTQYKLYKMCNAQEQTKSDSESLEEDTVSQEEEYDDENEMVLRAKWSIDNATTLDEVVEHLQSFIEYVKQLKADGWELTGTIDDDYGFLKRSR